MVKLITLGKYDHKYKYLIIYIIIFIPLEYLLGYSFPEEMQIKFLTEENFPDNVLINELFKYLMIFIYGIIISREEIKTIIEEKKNSNAPEIDENKNKIKLIYEENKVEYPEFSKYKVILLMGIYLISFELDDICYLLGFDNLDFWMLEIIFVIILNFFLFNIKAYKHQLIAICFVLIFSTLMRIIELIFVIKKDEEEMIYVKYKWIIPIGIIIFLLKYCLESYFLCRLKWYFELKFFSEKITFIYIGILGVIIFFIASIIPTFFECPENYFSSKICTVYENEGSAKYFESFIIFFKKIWSKERSTFLNCVYILILLLKIAYSAFKFVFEIIIIKVLDPMYFLCSITIIYFFIQIISFIYFLIVNKLELSFIFGLLSFVFSNIGTLIYLELVELNFCGLNHNLKKNIDMRALDDALDIYKEESDDDNNSRGYINLEENNS